MCALIVSLDVPLGIGDDEPFIRRGRLLAGAVASAVGEAAPWERGRWVWRRLRQADAWTATRAGNRAGGGSGSPGWRGPSYILQEVASWGEEARWTTRAVRERSSGGRRKNKSKSFYCVTWQLWVIFPELCTHLFFTSMSNSFIKMN